MKTIVKFLKDLELHTKHQMYVSTLLEKTKHFL